MKRDMTIDTSVPEYYRKLGDEVVDTPTGRMLSKEEQESLKISYFEYAAKVEREEQEALKMFKNKNYKRGRK